MGVSTIQRPESAHLPPPSGVHIFLPHNLVKCGICYAKVCLSDSLSVRPSVTLISHACTIQDIEIYFGPHDRGTFLVSGNQICNTEFRACGRNDCVNQRHPLATTKIAPIIHHISETCKTGRKLLLFTHRKSHTCFPLVPKSVTLNDLERRNGRYFALFRRIRPLPCTHPRKIAHGLRLSRLTHPRYSALDSGPGRISVPLCQLFLQLSNHGCTTVDIFTSCS